MSLPEPEKVALRYTRRVLVATDEWVNVLIGGDLDDTISARCARARDKGIWVGCIICKFLDLFQKNHCDIVLGKVKQG